MKKFHFCIKLEKNNIKCPNYSENRFSLIFMHD